MENKNNILITYPRKNYEKRKDGHRCPKATKTDECCPECSMHPAPDIGEEEKSNHAYYRKTDAESDKDKDYGIDEWIAHTLSPCPYRTIAMVPA